MKKNTIGLEYRKTNGKKVWKQVGEGNPDPVQNPCKIKFLSKRTSMKIIVPESDSCMHSTFSQWR